ncbi:MAG: tyrosine-type recombinase/integrase [Phycisphaerae bacterium]
MASISHSKDTGRRSIQVVCPDGKRRSIRLGKVTAKQAQQACTYIEDLRACLTTGSAPKPATAEWLAGVPDIIRNRLVRAGLCEPRETQDCPTLGEWLAEYVGSRKDVKKSTTTVYGHTRRNLLEYFGRSKPLDEITAGDADGFRLHLRTTESLSENTVRRRIGIAKQFFRAAVRRELIDRNPFDGLASTVRENAKRMHFVSLQEAEAVLGALPDADTRLVFALARYGGLRCPSEVARLKWTDVNWELDRFTVHASKTEHHEDGGIRIVPIFPELLPHLRTAFEQAEPGAIYCCRQYKPGIAGPMYRKILKQAIQQAGLKPWPKLFQNCRSSRETELAERFPVQVVCKWIGNSPSVAAKHYLQITDQHFAKAVGSEDKAVQKAVHFPVQSGAAQRSLEAHREIHGETQGAANPHKQRPAQRNAAPRGSMQKSVKPQSMGRTGLEPVTSRV